MELGTTILLLLYLPLAVATILRWRRSGRAALDHLFTDRDRRLLGATVFYLLMPLVVLAAQGVQLALSAALAGGHARFSSYIFFGVVDPLAGSGLGHLGHAGIAAAGPLTMVGIAALMAWTTARWPRHAALNFLRLETARLALILALGVHPVISLVIGEGDLFTIRTELNARYTGSGDAVLLSFGIVAAYAFFRWGQAKALRRLASPLYDALRAAESSCASRPDDPVALRTLGATQLANEIDDATHTLERARQLDPDDARTALLLGRAHLSDGHPMLAAKHLRIAGQLLEAARDVDTSTLFEVTLALSAARMALGDGEGAILTAQAARETSPLDPRGVLMHIDALVAGGHRDEARTRLEDALTSAEGRLRFELRRRLAALRR